VFLLEIWPSVSTVSTVVASLYQQFRNAFLESS
jgi:hypothetical protein